MAHTTLQFIEFVVNILFVTEETSNLLFVKGRLGEGGGTRDIFVSL